MSLENSDFEGLRPRLHSKISDFQRLSVLAISMHEITLYAIDIHKNRFITPFLTLKNHFGKQTSIRPRIVQHPRPCHMLT